MVLQGGDSPGGGGLPGLLAPLVDYGDDEEEEGDTLPLRGEAREGVRREWFWGGGDLGRGGVLWGRGVGLGSALGILIPKPYTVSENGRE